MNGLRGPATLRAEKFLIRLPRPFRIAHGSSDTRETILVHLQDGKFEAHGEGALPPYYPSRADACLNWLAEIDAGSLPGGIPPAPPAAAAARVALEIALEDLQAQRAGIPLWRAHGLDMGQLPPCARTVSIAENERELRDMLDEGIAAGARHFKLKLGSGDLLWDETCVRIAAEACPEANVSIDVNGGWTPRQAVEILPRLAVSFAEQPVPREISHWRELRSLLREANVPPLVADESVQDEADIEALRGLADGVNVKLLKAGGLHGARDWITIARKNGLRVMIGVMVETGIGRTAAAHLAPLADWLDIDPPDSIPFAPMSGIAIEGERLVFSGGTGLGLEKMEGRRHLRP